MRICHVITKPELGGAQLSTLGILHGLPKDKYDISVITSSRGFLAPEFKNIDKIKSYTLDLLSRRINPLLDILAFMHIFIIYRSNKFSLVHTHSSKAGFLGRWAAYFTGVPVILHTVHGWSFNDYQNIVIKKIIIFLEKLTARFTTKIICVSDRDIETGLKYRIALKSKFVLIKYGIDLSRFKRDEKAASHKRKELGINNDYPIVAMISCLKKQKSPMDYVRAAIEIDKYMKCVNFLLIGDGVLRTKCRQLLSKSDLNARFIFTGWRRDVDEILDITDIMVLTSKWEGMPIAVIEALSKGCPVVATDAGGTSEIVKNGVTGYLTRPGFYQDTANRVLNILQNKDVFDRMRQETVLSINDSYDVRNMIKKIDSLYNIFYG